MRASVRHFERSTSRCSESLDGHVESDMNVRSPNAVPGAGEAWRRSENMRAGVGAWIVSSASMIFTWGMENGALADGRFSAVTYNVAGLLELFSSSNPSANTPIISCKLRGYTLVNVQEDFNYHASLYDSCDDHPFRSA